jgi:hypothetical protein
MEFERIWRNIKIVTAWVQGSCPPKSGWDHEILKPLNKLIDFQRQECIYENGFRL